MTVKDIFKILLGTILATVLISVLVELFNVNMTSTQLNRIANLAGSQAAALFAQETYKTDSGQAGSSKMHDIYSYDGGIYLSGDFYGGLATEEAIYNKLYKNSSDFKQWASENRGKWLSVDSISYGLGIGGGLDSLSQQSGVMYVQNCVTPLNMGVPYLDKETVQKMFRWNLAALFSNNNSAAIVRDDSGKYYVSYSGFRIYASEAYITNIEYRTYNIAESGDAQEFYEVTNVNPAGLNGNSLTFGTYTPDTEAMTTLANGVSYGDERAMVCVVGIEYSIPVAYEGITPIKTVFEYVWNQEVEGFDGNIPARDALSWQDGTVNLKSGGFQDYVDVGDSTPVPGKLIYYIIR